jgi:hypothetical protein
LGLDTHGLMGIIQFITLHQGDTNADRTGDHAS